MNYSRFLTRVSGRRRPSVIRELNRPFPAEVVLFTAGKPNPALFPFSKATFETDTGERIEFEGSALKEALQYQNSTGVPDLVRWLEELQRHVHSPPCPTKVAVTSGSMEGLSKAVEMMLNEGDPVALESFVYPGVLSLLSPFEPEFVVAESDGLGMIPESLEARLEGKKAKLLYVNPTGANPTGTVLPEERRRAIYDIASRHDLVVLEDDPYHFLQFGAQKPPSFLSMDVDGRVLRFDSFSKVLSSGLRLGFVTGPQPLVERITLHMQVSSMHANSLSQLLAFRLLSGWGRDGFFRHVDRVEAFYRERRDAMMAAADEHLRGVCEWSEPQGGMFLWMKVLNVEDTWDMMMEEAPKVGVMAIPGAPFQPGGGKSPFLRASYSVADLDDFRPGMERLARVIERHLYN